jgi:hypothetical protein
MERAREPIIRGGNMNEESPAEKNPARDLPDPSEPAYPRTPTIVD